MVEPNRSLALQSETSINNPLHLVLLIGSIASFVCGLLNFGQGMTFAVLWNLARYLDLLESNETFSQGVVYGQIFGFFALIPVVIAGWREVFLLIGYSSIMLAVMNYVSHSFHSNEFLFQPHNASDVHDSFHESFNPFHCNC